MFDLLLRLKVPRIAIIDSFDCKPYQQESKEMCGINEYAHYFDYWNQVDKIWEPVKESDRGVVYREFDLIRETE